jgi:hypothetical protein
VCLSVCVRDAGDDMRRDDRHRSFAPTLDPILSVPPPSPDSVEPPPPHTPTPTHKHPPHQKNTTHAQPGHVDLEAYLVTYAFLPESPVVTAVEYRNTSLTPDDIGAWGPSRGSSSQLCDLCVTMLCRTRLFLSPAIRLVSLSLSPSLSHFYITSPPPTPAIRCRPSHTHTHDQNQTPTPTPHTKGVDGTTDATTRIAASTLTMRLPGPLERDTQVHTSVFGTRYPFGRVLTH